MDGFCSAYKLGLNLTGTFLHPNFLYVSAPPQPLKPTLFYDENVTS